MYCTSVVLHAASSTTATSLGVKCAQRRGSVSALREWNVSSEQKDEEINRWKRRILLWNLSVHRRQQRSSRWYCVSVWCELSLGLWRQQQQQQRAHRDDGQGAVLQDWSAAGEVRLWAWLCLLLTHCVSSADVPSPENVPIQVLGKGRRGSCILKRWRSKVRESLWDWFRNIAEAGNCKSRDLQPVSWRLTLEPSAHWFILWWSTT